MFSNAWRHVPLSTPESPRVTNQRMYNIVSEADLRDAMQKTSEYISRPSGTRSNLTRLPSAAAIADQD